MSEGAMIFVVILFGVGIWAVTFVLRRLANKGMNAVERAIRPEAAQKADDLLGTAVIFESTAPLSRIREEIARNVPIVDKIGHKMKVLGDSNAGITWSVGLPKMGNGAVVDLKYKENDNGSIAMFVISEHVMQSSNAISPFVKQITELRNQVITAFNSA
ncbi:MAG: hypothetical protein FWB97_09330, partial [Oscillospiraceae bacterium]|nr:hypothetical protein [Oscillospiraceae bacterium]